MPFDQHHCLETSEKSQHKETGNNPAALFRFQITHTPDKNIPIGRRNLNNNYAASSFRIKTAKATSHQTLTGCCKQIPKYLETSLGPRSVRQYDLHLWELCLGPETATAAD